MSNCEWKLKHYSTEKMPNKIKAMRFKGCGMGTLFALVSPCLRENVVWKSNFKMALIWKKGYFDLLFKFFSHQGKVTKIPTAHISLTYIQCILLTLLTFLALPIWKKNTNLSGMVSLWYESWCWFLFAPFWNNQQITKWWAKFKLECLLLICVYTNAKFIVICKPRTLNGGGEDSVQYRNRKKHCFLGTAILLFYR